MVSRTARRVVTVLLIVAFASLAIGHIIGQPVLFAYVDSGSMEPTIDAGDGFVAIPAVATPPPQEGDIITFEAETVEGGGLTTHRVVGETADGYITRGDANPFTDQDGGEPPVTEDQILAEALQFGDFAVVIPHFGTVVEGIQGLLAAVFVPIATAFGLSGATTGTAGLVVFAVGVVLFVWSTIGDRRGGPERDLSRSTGSEDRLDTRRLAIIVLLVVLVPANASMVAVDGTTEFVVDGDEVTDAPGVSAGDEIEAEFDIRNSAFLTMLFALEADGDVTVQDESISIPPGETATTMISVPAPPPGTERTVTVTQHQYFVLLPEGAILSLYAIHPFVALAGLNAFIVVGYLGFIAGLFGFGEVQFRQTSRDVPVTIVIKRWLRS